MASWLPFLSGRWAKNKSNAFQLDGGVAAGDIGTLTATLDRWDDLSLTLLIPSSSKSMTALHSFWTHEGDLLLGIKGVNGAAPLVAYDLSHLSEPFLPLTSAEAIQELVLPSITQFLNCVAESASAKDILGIEGDSGVKAREMTELTSFVPVNPPELEAILKMAGPVESTRLGIKSITALRGIMELASTTFQSGQAGEDQVAEIWEARLQALWLAAKGLTSNPKTRNPVPMDEAIDDRYMDLMGSFLVAPENYSDQGEGDPGPEFPQDLRGPRKSPRKIRSNKNNPANAPVDAEVYTESPSHKPEGRQSSPIGKNRSHPKTNEGEEDPESGPLLRPFGQVKRGHENPDRDSEDESEEETKTARRANSYRQTKRGRETRTSRMKERRSERERRARNLGDSGDSSPSSDSESDSDNDYRKSRASSRPRKAKKITKHRKKTTSDDSDSDSSLFGSSDSSSSQSLPKKRHKKSRRSQIGARDHDRPLADSIAYLADEMGYNNRVAHRKELRRSSLLSAWTKESVRLLRLLSARRWSQSGTPKIQKETKQVMNLKKVTGAISQIRQDSHDWEGTVCQSGLTKFLAEGFLAQEITDSPGGMTVFMCIPLSKSRLRQSAEERERALNESFGVGHLSEATAKELSKAELFLPEDLNDALDQLSVIIRLLDYLTGRRSIASETYRFGRSFITERRREFSKAQRSDPLFITKYLYMLDRIFQRFCQKLLMKTHGKSDPIRYAARALAGFQSDCVTAEMRSFDTIGAIPPLPLPTIVEERPSRANKKVESEKDLTNNVLQKGTELEKKKKVPLAKFDKVENPEAVPGWRIPPGKVYTDLFGKAHPENTTGFPKVAHHDATKKRPVKPCLSWHFAGRCDRKGNCFSSHIPASAMSPDDRKAISDKVAQVYA